MANAEPLLVGPHYSQMPRAWHDQFEGRALQMLYRALNTRRVVAVVGSGISIPWGYPSWSKLSENVARLTLKRTKAYASIEAQDELRARMLSLGAPEGPGSEQREPLLLTLCADVLREAQSEHSVASIVAELIREKSTKISKPSPDPLELILKELEIRRFMTTNYDSVIEDRLRTFGSRPHDQPRYSHAQSEKLVAFAVGAPETEGVYHLHGHVGDPSTMVITEEDYQRVYLETDEKYRAYRESLSLAFSANPIIFLGVGMREADLLRPLREFASDRRYDPREKPIFAVLPSSTEEADSAFRLQLYDQYGVKTIFFTPKGTQRDARSRALCAKIREIRSGWTSWWSEWREIPELRDDEFVREAANVMTRNRPNLDGMLVGGYDSAKVDEIAAKLQELSSVTVHGDRGAGLGTLESVLRKKLVGIGSRVFSANLHFANDLRSTLEGAARFFGQPPGTDRTVFTRLEAGLAEPTNVLLLSGLDRLVTADNQPLNLDAKRLFLMHGRIRKLGGQGPYSPPRGLVLFCRARLEAEEEILCLERREGEQVSTSGDRPKGEEPPGCVRVTLPAPVPGRRAAVELALGSLFGRYLIGRVSVAHVERIESMLQARSEQRRVVRLIDWIVRYTLENGQHPVWAFELLLAALSFNAEPISRSIALDIAHRAATRLATTTDPPSPPPTLEELTGMLESLHQAGLVLEFSGQGLDGAEYQNATHTQTRSYIREAFGAAPGAAAEPYFFGLVGFTGETPSPSSSTDRVFQTARRFLDALDHGDTLLPQRGGSSHEVTRTYLGYLRANFSSTTLSRFAHLSQDRDRLDLGVPHFDAYLRRLCRVIDTARASPGSLRRDELTWTYFELALAAWSQGSLHDAHAVAEVTRRLIADDGEDGGQTYELELLFGQIETERGRLSRAQYHFGRASDIAKGHSDLLMSGRAEGHLALVHHLRGEHHRALACYDRSIEELQKHSGTRAQAAFLRHRADLKRLRGDYPGAKTDLIECVALAEAGRHYDVLYGARVAQAHTQADGDNTNNRREATSLLEMAGDFARRAGLPKLEADVLKIQSEMALERGQLEHAARLASRCLGISALLGMRLRVAAGLVLRGRIAIARGDVSGAQTLLLAARSMAYQMDYQVQVEKAERQLIMLGVEPDLFDSATDRRRRRTTDAGFPTGT